MISSSTQSAEKWDFFPETVKTIAIVAPAKPGMKKNMDAGVANLQAAGYQVKIMPHARMYEAPSDGTKVPRELRLSDFMTAWLDPEVDLIWCLRGGDFAEELLPGLDYVKMRQRRVIVVGFSNITALHQVMQKNGVGRVFSGPSVTSMLRTDEPSRIWFRKCICEDELPPVKLTALRTGPCSARATGGHITMLRRAVVSGNAMATDGRIVFLESDSGDMNFNNDILDDLIARSYFNGCKAVIFGEFCNMTTDDQLAMFKHFAAKVAFPVYYGYPYGHGNANFLIDMEREKSIGEDGMLRQ